MKLINGQTKYTTYHDSSAADVDDLLELLRIESGDESETYLDNLLIAATQHAEGFLSRTLLHSELTRQYEVKEEYPGLALEYKKAPKIYLPLGPVVTVDRVYWVAQDGEETDIDDYQEDTVSEPAKLFTHEMFSLAVGSLLRIDYTAGYGEYADSVPRAIQQGILQHAAYLYEHRGDCPVDDAAVKSGAQYIYGRYRVWVM